MYIRSRRALVFVAWSVLVIAGAAAGFGVHTLWEFRERVERLARQLTLDVGPESTLLYDANNNVVSALYEEHRIPVRLGEMSPAFIDAVLVTEDRRFFEHDGIDVRRIVAAFLANQKAGEIVEGGSTITQQLVRAILLDSERTYSRKMKEALLALRLEERYSKHDILEAYLNRVYFGDGYYGVQAAAMGYFGKRAHELDAAEAATLAGLIKGPSIYAPTRNAEICRKRRDLVLDEMRKAGVLSEADYRAAMDVPVTALLARAGNDAIDPRHAAGAGYFRDVVSRELIEKFGSDTVYRGGLRVFTTLDPDVQRLAEETIASRLEGFDEGLQGALVALDPRTGWVKAVVGGRSFRQTPFNRAVDARRQPGSAFKPFVFAAALESGLSPGSIIDGLNDPIPTPQGPWLPGGEHESSSTTLRQALALSSNRAAAHLLQDVGIYRTLDLVQRAGISSPLPAVPSLALGAGEVSLFELTSAYGVFANSGVWKQPVLIRRVIDRYGRELYSAPGIERPVVSESTAYMMASMMSDVLIYGTGTRARGQGVKFKAAGKTGTSQDYSDAWFVGFTPSLVAGVWFGYDKPRPIAKRGFASVVAVPAWARFMSEAMRGHTHDWIEMPGGLVKVKICRLSGGLATDRCREPVYEPASDDTDRSFESAAGTVREGSVYEDVMPAGRVPPPCMLLHGVPLTLPAEVAAAPSSSSEAAWPPNVEPAGSRTGGVTPPPAFMTERRTQVISLPQLPERANPESRPGAVDGAVQAPTGQPANDPVGETAKPEPPAAPDSTTGANPIVPNVQTREPQNGYAPIVPGAPVDRSAPTAPRRPPHD